MNSAAKMNTIFKSAGKAVKINGEERTVVSVRSCYGASIELTLDRPLTGNTSPLFTVDEETSYKVRF